MKFLSIILVIIVAGAAIAAIRMFAGGEAIDKKHCLVAIIVAVALGLTNSLMTTIAKVPWLALIFLVALIYMSWMLMSWFHKEVSDYKEALPFAVMAVVNFFVVKAAAVATTGIIPSGVGASIVNTFLGYIPAAVLVGEILYGFYDLFTFEEEMKTIERDAKGGEAK